MNFSSKLIENAVREISKLPGIGNKTALRLVLHLLKQEEQNTLMLTEALRKLRQEIQYCNHCHFIADKPVCSICESKQRDTETICVVENSQDVIAIENTAQYKGLYHVLGGVISPMEGINPSDLNIQTLIERLQKPSVKELIFALSPTMEGDTTSFYIRKKIQNPILKITSIARGIPVGSEIEYTDEITLGRSILLRTSQK